MVVVALVEALEPPVVLLDGVPVLPEEGPPVLALTLCTCARAAATNPRSVGCIYACMRTAEP